MTHAIASLALVTLVSAANIHGQVLPICPAKIRASLCYYEFFSRYEHEYIQARITLFRYTPEGYDAATLKPGKTFQQEWADSMYAKYDLRDLFQVSGNRLSAPPDGMDMDAYSVHNVSATKATLIELKKEAYVEAIDQGCSGKISETFCNSLQAMSGDSTFVNVRVVVAQPGGNSDSASIRKGALLEALLVGYELRLASDPGRRVETPAQLDWLQSGLMARKKTIRQMAAEPYVATLESWSPQDPVSAIPRAVNKPFAWTPRGYDALGRSVSTPEAPTKKPARLGGRAGHTGDGRRL